MTVAFSAADVLNRLGEQQRSGIVEADNNVILVKSETLPELMEFLKNTSGLDFDYLVDIAATDYWDYFELVYQLVSIKNNHNLVVKTRLSGRDDIKSPSVTHLYSGANFMEREIYDLMGIKFEGHHNLKHIFLWEGFRGYPLRRDYL